MEDNYKRYNAINALGLLKNKESYPKVSTDHGNWTLELGLSP